MYNDKSEQAYNREEMAQLASTGWGRVAHRYAEELYNELSYKPFDQEWLKRFALAVPEASTVVDVGCGPGHVTHHLAGLGLDVQGLDLSEGMIQQARELQPKIPFHVGNMLELGAPEHSWGGIVSMYALIHLIREDVPLALAGFRRVLKPGSPLLISVHCGSGVITAEEVFGEKVQIAATLFEADEMRGYVEEAGFTIEDLQTREPYEQELATMRLYVFAKS